MDSLTRRDKEGALVFFMILMAYLLISPLAVLFTESRMVQLLAKLLVVGCLIWWKREWFSFKLKWDSLSVAIGVVIGLLWVGLDSFYPSFSTADISPYSMAESILKLIIGLLIAPLVEEFFTRFFLHRYLASQNWLAVPQGTYTLWPFIITTLFFGLSHTEWLAGLITGLLLNWLWYRKKDMNSVVVAHAVANLILGAMVIYFGLWHFW